MDVLGGERYYREVEVIACIDQAGLRHIITFSQFSLTYLYKYYISSCNLGYG
jgi:hypothetical protein